MWEVWTKASLDLAFRRDLLCSVGGNLLLSPQMVEEADAALTWKKSAQAKVAAFFPMGAR